MISEENEGNIRIKEIKELEEAVVNPLKGNVVN